LKIFTLLDIFYATGVIKHVIESLCSEKKYRNVLHAIKVSQYSMLKVTVNRQLFAIQTRDYICLFKVSDKKKENHIIFLLSVLKRVEFEHLQWLLKATEQTV